MILFAFLPLGVLWVWNWYIDCEVSFQSWMSLNLAELNTELHTGNGSRVSRSSFERGYGNSRHSFLYLSSNSKWLTLYQGAGMKCTTDNAISRHFMKPKQANIHGIVKFLLSMVFTHWFSRRKELWRKHSGLMYNISQDYHGSLFHHSYRLSFMHLSYLLKNGLRCTERFPRRFRAFGPQEAKRQRN